MSASPTTQMRRSVVAAGHTSSAVMRAWAVVDAIARRDVWDLDFGAPAEWRMTLNDDARAAEAWARINTRSRDRPVAAARMANAIRTLVGRQTLVGDGDAPRGASDSGAATAAAEASTQTSAAVTRKEYLEIVDELDILMAAAIVEGIDKRNVAPSTVGNEAGAMMALCERLLPSQTRPAWPRADAARRTLGDKVASAVKHRTRRDALSPEAIHTWMFELGDQGDLSMGDAMAAAAIAIGSAFSLRVSATAHLRTEELSLLVDPVHQSAMMLGYVPRLGSKTVATVATKKQIAATMWVAAATPTLHAYARPWLNMARARKWKYLFPRGVAQDGGSFDDYIRTHALQRLAKRVGGPKASWHGLRIGTMRALKRVHTIDEPGGQRGVVVSDDTIRSLQMRSALSARGSLDVYDKAVVEPMLQATRWMHRVEWCDIGGLLTSDPIEELTAPYESTCQECGEFMDVSTTGTLCDFKVKRKFGCQRTICEGCHELGTRWLCPEHGGKPDDSDSDATDARSD